MKATDLFCGCGGSTTGAASVEGVEVTHAFNHWERAVESHAENHPKTDAALTDLFEVHPAAFPAMDILLASPECRTHSPAAGSRRKNLSQLDFFDHCDLSPDQVKSRATMWTVVHWASVHRPKFVIVENVVEIHYWPELRAWFREMMTLGYHWRRVYVNAMHVHGLLDRRIRFMAPQSRDRIYVVFWKKGDVEPDLSITPLAWCAACEADVAGVQAWKRGRTWGRYRRQYVYRCPRCAGAVEPYAYAAASAIDFGLPSQRIGDRERPLSEKTLARIRYGLEKYGLRPYVVVSRYSSGVECRVKDTLEPLPTQPSQPVAYLVETAYSHAPDNRVRPVTGPLPTQSTRATQALVVTHKGRSNSHPVEDPLTTVTAGAINHSLVFPNRTNGKARPASEPMHTVTTGSTLGLLTVLHGTGKAKPSEEPMPCVTAGGLHHGLVTDEAALCTLRGDRHFSGLDDSLPTQTGAQQVAVVSKSDRLIRSPYLVSYYGTHNAAPACEPLSTVTTVDRHALVDGGTPDVEDLHFRMLEPHELKVGTGHPRDYVLLGTKRDKVRLIGNSNFPGIEQLLVMRCLESLAP